MCLLTKNIDINLKGIEEIYITNNFEIECLKERFKYVHDYVERKSSGTAFHIVGPARENERRS